MQIFARITKVDEQTGVVHGRAVQEMLDRSGEIFDYESSRPLFEKWSTDIGKATGGKSVGNIRAMHGNVAAGKLTGITFNDAEKAIDVEAKIVDPIERAKLAEGVYSGFSIGGKYARKWQDAADTAITRYTAEPSEISLVDMPCVPTAMFTVVKADGAEELRKFHTTFDDDGRIAKWLDTLTDAQRETLTKALESKPEPGDLQKVAPVNEDQVMNDELQKAHDATKAELAKAAGDLAKAADDLTKMTVDRDDLAKAFAAANAEVAKRDELLVKAAAALDERNEVITKFQNAPAPIKAALMAVAKGQDIPGEKAEVEPVLGADGKPDASLTEIRKALMNPVLTR